MPRTPKKLHKKPIRPTGKMGKPLAARPQGKSIQLDLEKYYLRSLRKLDATAEFANWIGDPDVLAALNLPALNMSITDLRAYIGRANNRSKYMIGIFAKPEMKLIGFYQVDVDLKHRRAALTAAIGDRDWWGESVLRQTMGPLGNFLFEHRNIDKLSFRITSFNKRILFSLIGGKFKHEGCLRQEVLTPDGRRLDLHAFGWIKDT